ncbi:MAG: hypothetical protein GC165_07510 [Armatimonadetes bacterium]|nr:hypothetical protein [Armatimonadota bacterium]
MPNPPEHQPSYDFFNSIWAWVSALVAGIFHVGVTSQKFRQVEEKVDRLESVHEDIAVIKSDLGWIKEKLK